MATGRPVPEPAAVVGWADIYLPYHPDADIRSFGFDAHATPYTHPVPGLPGLPNDAEGTVTVSHYRAATGATETARGTAPVTRGGYTVTHADLPPVPARP